MTAFPTLSRSLILKPPASPANASISDCSSSLSQEHQHTLPKRRSPELSPSSPLPEWYGDTNRGGKRARGGSLALISVMQRRASVLQRSLRLFKVPIGHLPLPARLPAHAADRTLVIVDYRFSARQQFRLLSVSPEIANVDHRLDIGVIPTTS